VSIRPFTWSRTKKIKEASNEIIQDIWALFPTKLANSICFSTYTRVELIFIMSNFMLIGIIFDSIICSG
jgi:hypothetical protein